jgi:uncharacterized protein (DUF433 family)
MSRYALNLPAQLKADAEQAAGAQGVSLNQFILWAVAEKVGAIKQGLDDSHYPQITYRRGSSGLPQAVIRETGLRVQTLVIGAKQWGLSVKELADEYNLKQAQVKEALAFYDAHQQEIDEAIALEVQREHD